MIESDKTKEAVTSSLVQPQAIGALLVSAQPSTTSSSSTLPAPVPSGWKERLEVPQQFTTIVANLVVVAGIVGVFFAYRQWQDARRAEITQSAITAISQTRTPEFLRAYARLVNLQRSRDASNRTQAVADSGDLDYVVNTYDQIALLYLNGLVEKCLIKRATEDALRTLSPLWTHGPYSKDDALNIEAMREAMTRERCR